MRCTLSMFGFVMLGSCLGANATGTDDETGPTGETAVRYPFVSVVRKTPDHHGFVLVNGHRVLAFTSADSRTRSKAFPLENGVNNVTVQITADEEPTGKSVGEASVRLLLTRRRILDKPYLPLGHLNTEEYGARLDCRVTVQDARPVRYRTLSREWYDRERQHLYVEMTARGRVGATYYDSVEHRRYYRHGEPLYFSRHEDGRLITARSYKPDGAVASETQEGTGQLSIFHADGTLGMVRSFANGRLHGWCRLFYPSGNVKAEKQFVRGELNGPCLRYYEDGSILRKQAFVDGRRNGPWLVYAPGGKLLLLKSMFKDGERVRPEARTVHDPRRGFTVKIPAGFDTLHAECLNSRVHHGFVSFDPETDEPACAIVMTATGQGPWRKSPPYERIKAIVNYFTMLENILRQAQGDTVAFGESHVKLGKRDWRGRQVHEARLQATVDGRTMYVCCVAVPVGETGILTGVKGYLEQKFVVERHLATLLDSLRPDPPERQEPAEASGRAIP